MISIIMTYYNRQEQLLNTLESFKKYNSKDFDVTIVDDGSPEDIVIPDYNFQVNIIKIRDKKWNLGVPAWNIGIFSALKNNPDILILQNAECYHMGDILGTAKKVTDDIYLTFGCYSQGKGEEIGSIINNKKATFDGESAWYNHPTHNPRALHFCSAVTAKNMIKINGFDERFSFGTNYDDDYLLWQFQRIGLKVGITDSPYVIHQWHYSHTPRPDYGELSQKNRELLIELIKKNDYWAKHIFTDDFIPYRISDNYAVSTHQPIIRTMLKMFNPGFVLELGIGHYSTPLFKDLPCEKMFIENDKAWIDEMGVPGVIQHEIPITSQDVPIYNISEDLKGRIKTDYENIRDEIKTNNHNILFVDNYSCCRSIAINTLFPKFDIIIYHDCEPQSIHRNNYYFCDEIKLDFDHYYLVNPRTWTGVFIRKGLNQESIYEELQPFIEQYYKENNIEWMFLHKGLNG